MPLGKNPTQNDIINYYKKDVLEKCFGEKRRSGALLLQALERVYVHIRYVGVAERARWAGSDPLAQTFAMEAVGASRELDHGVVSEEERLPQAGVAYYAHILLLLLPVSSSLVGGPFAPGL